MAGDYSRFTHDPRRRFSELLLQQGRVQLDSDWNEQIEILSRRFQTQALDTFGPDAVSRLSTPDAFEVALLAGPPLDFSLGVGRAYVDGLPAEIFPGEAISYLSQPFVASPPPLEDFAGETVLAYLDLWQREVTAIEDPRLLEKALGGPDTTARTQLVWQVKILGEKELGSVPSCAVDLDALYPPSAGRLSSRAVQPPAGTDPCVLPESGGFRGLENRLYRVEIHLGGDATQARFKWSRENASVVSAVEAIATAGTSTLTVSRIGRDPILRFAIDDWVEVIDDRLELAGLPGHMARVVDLKEETRTLLLDRALPAADFDPTDQSRHTRVRRWDQRDGVDADGLLSIAAGWTALEDGIEVHLELDPATGRFHTGDIWVCAARVADASVEELNLAPPRAIVHHYTPLATIINVGPSASVNDCRTLWPPLGEGGGDCECTVCVTAESHADGSMTLEAAVALVRERGGGKICVGVGTFLLERTLEINGARALEIRGRGAASVIIFAGQGDAIRIVESADVRLHDVAIAALREGATSSAIAIESSQTIAIERCFLVAGRAVSLGALLADVGVRDCFVVAREGVGLADGKDGIFYAIDLEIEDNFFNCADSGVSLWSNNLEAGFVFLDGIEVRDNFISNCWQGAVRLSGFVLPGSGVRIEENEIRTSGAGIVFNTTDTVIRGNEISGSVEAPVQGRAHTGIIFLTPRTAQRIEIRDNDLSTFLFDGISLLGEAELAIIADNTLTQIGLSGIVMGDDATVEKLLVTGNVLRNIGVGDSNRDVHAGIHLLNAADVDISGNHLDRVLHAGRTGVVSGIRVDASRAVRIGGNTVLAIGVASQGRAYGIEVRNPLGEVTVSDNRVSGDVSAVSSAGSSLWAPLSIGRELAAAGTNLAATSVLYAGNMAFTLRASAIFAVLRPRVRVGIHGNFLDAERSFVPAAHIDLTASGSNGDCIFSENRCELVAMADTTAAAAAWIRSFSVVASNNLLRGSVETSLRVDAERYTILGNLSDGNVMVNGAPLGAPWQPLNFGA